MSIIEIDHTKCQPEAHDFDWYAEDYGGDEGAQRHNGDVRQCNDCGALLFYCQNDHDYHHGGVNAGPCFLVQNDMPTAACVLALAVTDRLRQPGDPVRVVCITHHTGEPLGPDLKCPQAA